MKKQCPYSVVLLDLTLQYTKLFTALPHLGAVFITHAMNTLDCVAGPEMEERKLASLIVFLAFRFKL